MDCEIERRFIVFQKRLNEYEYIFSTIAYFAASTIKGKKPASLLTFIKDKRNLYSLWVKNKDKLSEQFGISYYELKRTKNYIIVLFYNLLELEAYINAKGNLRFLEECGYIRGSGVNLHLKHLKDRFNNVCPMK